MDSPPPANAPVQHEHVPPLPPALLSVLARASLCYLATSEDGAPHLCLMSFSWLSDAEDADAAGAGAAGAAGGSGAFVLATKRATKKFDAISANARVALLVHDFATLRAQYDGAAGAAGAVGAAGVAGAGGAAAPAHGAGTVSVTIYGDAEIVPEGPRAERLRAFHASRSPSYAHFSAGEGVAMLAVRPRMARICDVQDRVQLWSGAGGPEGSGAGGGGGGGGGGGPSSPRLLAAAERLRAAEGEAEQLRDMLLEAEERAGALAEELEARQDELAELKAERAAAQAAAAAAAAQQVA